MHIHSENIVVIAAKSTPEFVRTVFEMYARKTVFAIARPDVEEDARLKYAERLQLSANHSAGWVDTRFTPIFSDDPAQIVFSSGTEGKPKAIVLSHRNLADVVARLNAAMKVTSEIREYVGVPVTYSFGLGRTRAVATAGGACYIPKKFDLSEIRRMLEQKEINAISAVPSLCRILLKSSDMLRPVANRVRWIEIGSQFMSVGEKVAMKRLFPRARIVQHYGLTEASRSTFLDLTSTSEAELGSVGRTDGPVEGRINANGAICLRGDNVALGQLEGKEGQVTPLANKDGWLTTKDQGELRGNHLYFLGRLDDQINISGVKISADQLEQGIARRVPGQEGQFAIAAVDDPMRGNAALLAVSDAAADLLPVLKDAAHATLEHHGIAGGDNLRTLKVGDLPRTGSGKVQRKRLRDSYLQERRTQNTQNKPSILRRIRQSVKRARPASVKEVFEAHFPNATITPQTSFDTLGGDSLSYLSVALDLETIMGDLPDNWQDMSVERLEKNARVTGWMGKMDTPTFMRALAIVLVVAGHFDALNYGGTGAFTLFFIAGLNFGALTLPSVLHRQSLEPIFVLLLRVAMITWLYTTLNWIATGYGNPLTFLLMTNWIHPNYEGAVWFIEVYIQTLLFLGLLLAQPLRNLVQEHAFAALAILAVFMVAVMFLSEQVWDTSHLYRRLPHLLAWIFICGALAHFSDTWLRKIVTGLIVFSGWLVFTRFDLALNLFVLVVPAILILPSVTLPRIAIPSIRMIASASLLIYLSHFQFRSLLEQSIGGGPALATLVAVVGGVMAWMCYRPFDDRIRAVSARLIGLRKQDQNARPSAQVEREQRTSRN